MAEQCEAKEYGDCYRHTELVDVIFKYRGKSGYQRPDEIVKVCMCIGHHKILKKIHQTTEEKQFLEMRGETHELAMHDDLFQHFSNKSRMYTLIHAELYEQGTENTDHVFYLFQGRDVIKMCEVIYSWETSLPNIKYAGTFEEGFFQTTFQFAGESNQYQEVVIEHKKIFGKLPLDALASIKKMFSIDSDGEIRTVDIPSCINGFFQTKLDLETFKNFEECVEFIEGEIDKNIISWEDLRENSAHTLREVFDKSQQFTKALKNNDVLVPSKMFELGDLTPEVLWVTYITINHYLFSDDTLKELKKNTILIDWMISHNLQKSLLALAISGERERYLMVKRRAHYNILYENEFVVDYLVPRHISGETKIYINADEKKQLTPLEYWHYFNNYLTHISNGNFNNEPFEKNEKIRMHLENHTLGALDISLLPPDALEIYNIVVIQNGHSAAEFIILGYQSFFEPNYVSVVNGRTATLEETERFLPGITEMYEQKKRDLRKNTYHAWEFVNNKLRKEAYAACSK